MAETALEEELDEDGMVEAAEELIINSEARETA